MTKSKYLRTIGNVEHNDFPIIDRIDNDDFGKERGNDIFPIMSISKTFCGATCALMATEGKFGDKKLEVTVKELLDLAKEKNPAQVEKIEKYQEGIAKHLGDIRLSELLSHRSGILRNGFIGLQQYTTKESGGIDGFLNECLIPSDERGTRVYCNDNFALVEQLVNCLSPKGYKKELEDRILNPLNLQNTRRFSDPKAKAAQDRIGKGINSKTFEEFDVSLTDPTGVIPLAAGGLSSCVNDMKVYSEELAKMILGRDSLLTTSLTDEQKREIATLYQDEKYIHEQRDGKSQAYSLGVEVTSKNGVVTRIAHGGGFPSNTSGMKVEVNDKNELNSTFFTQQQSPLASFITKHFEEEILSKYLDSKLSEEEKGHEFLSPWLKQEYLKQQGKLPKDFAEKCYAEVEGCFRKIEIYDAYQNCFSNYLNEDGVIDESKMRSSLPQILESLNQHPAISDAQKEALEVVQSFSSQVDAKKTQEAEATNSQSWASKVSARNAEPSKGAQH